jgi:anti-sigma regulatory factor (Ser/Thr protein kinase)
MSLETDDGRVSLTIPSTLAGLKEGSEALTRWLNRWNAGEEVSNRAHLVFDEVVTNIIRYAFDDKREHGIGVSFRLAEDSLTLIFDDDGRPFDPRAAPDPPRPGSLDKATIGGRGLLLVRKAAKGLDYQRSQSGRNFFSVELARA